MSLPSNKNIITASQTISLYYKIRSNYNWKRLLHHTAPWRGGGGGEAERVRAYQEEMSLLVHIHEKKNLKPKKTKPEP